MSVSLPPNFVISNAAGFVKNKPNLDRVLASAATRVMVGTLMPNKRGGNIGDTYWFDDATSTSYNSMGLPSPSPDEVMEWLPRAYRDAKAQGKELAVSIGGSKPEDYAVLAKLYAPYVDLIEGNWGCGNIWGPEGQKPIPSYHPRLARAIAQEIRHTVRNSVRVGFKISPIEPEHAQVLSEIMAILTEYADEVTGVNTKINQLPKRLDGKEALSWREAEGAEVKHTGGMGGKKLMPDGLRIASSLAHLPERIKVIGCGGIFTGEDALDYVQGGVDGIALGTSFMQFGPKIFSDVYAELID